MHAASAVGLAGLLFAGVPGVSLAGGGTAGQKDVSAVLRGVDAHYNHLHSLRARYAEHYAGMGMDRTETGTLELLKPGRMRWSYDTPPGKVFVVDGRFGWSYTPGDGQVQRVSAKQLDDPRSPLRFLLGRARLEKELEGASVQPSGTGYRISGTPRGMAGRVKALTLEVTAADVISVIRVEEVDGAATEFRFSEVVENAPMPGKAFVFTPPQSVGVVEALPPV